MRSILRLRVPSNMKEVRRLNDTAARFLQEQRASHAAIHDVQLVLEEVTTNVIRHASPLQGSITMQVELEVEPAGVRVRVEDDGAAFDPTTAPERGGAGGAANGTSGGFGLRIIRRTAIGLDYRRHDNHNVFEMLVPFI